MRKEMRDLLDQAAEQGWRVERTRKGWMLFSPDGVTKVVVHGTESDANAIRLTRARLRRGGFTEG